jgi:hypothetical protein
MQVYHRSPPMKPRLAPITGSPIPVEKWSTSLEPIIKQTERNLINIGNITTLPVINQNRTSILGRSRTPPTGFTGFHPHYENFSVGDSYNESQSTAVSYLKAHHSDISIFYEKTG